MFKHLNYYDILNYIIIVSIIILFEIATILYLIIIQKQRKSSNRIKSDLLSEMNHKMRTPLKKPQGPPSDKHKTVPWSGPALFPSE